MGTGQHPTQNPKTTFKNSNDWQSNRSLQRHGEARILHTREEALILVLEDQKCGVAGLKVP